MNTHPSHELIFSTTLITTDSGRGTGLFYRFFEGENYGPVPAVITNKHVIENAEKIFLEINTIDKDGKYAPGQHIRQEIIDPLIINHSDPDVDLCAILIGKTIGDIQKLGKQTHIIALTKKHISTTEELERLTTLEDVIMVGYPIGLSDTANNLPIVRKGITATPVFMNYNNKKEFVIDVACFPGSSGSPIFSYKEGFLVEGDKVVQKGSIRLLGNLYGGPQYSLKGEITTMAIPTQYSHTNILINLGYIIKAERILELEKFIKEYLKL